MISPLVNHTIFFIIATLFTFTYANVNVTAENATSKLVGRWELEESEHFEDYLAEIGVGWFSRKVGASIKIIKTISNDGDNWSIRIEASVKTGITKFVDGIVFTEDTMEGRR